jgi:hypothetical protein
MTMNHRITLSIAVTEVVLTFMVGDAADVACAANWLSLPQLAAWVLSYLLIAFGVLFTAYSMEFPSAATTEKLHESLAETVASVNCVIRQSRSLSSTALEERQRQEHK